MMHDIDTSAIKTKDAAVAAAEAVAHGTRNQAGRLERFAHVVLRALPLVPERLFESALLRMGLMRRPSPLGTVAAFASGFAAGGLVTALVTPVSGPELRAKLIGLVRARPKTTENPSTTIPDADPVAQTKSTSAPHANGG